MIPCHRARARHTGCVARDGRHAAADNTACVGCGHDPADLLRDLFTRYPKRAPIPIAALDQTRPVADRYAILAEAYVLYGGEQR